MIPPVYVVGASGRSGAALCRVLLAAGTPFVPVVRNVARWQATGLPGAPRLLDLLTPDRAALTGAARVVSCAHARHAGTILRISPASTHVFLGSTRRYSRWPDAHGDGVRAGEAALLAAGRPGVMLHPTMIYGAEGEDNVQRLAALLRRLPIVPLPGSGQSLVQPIHQADLTRCILAALDHAWTGPEVITVAGPAPVTYAAFVRAIAAAAGLRAPRIVPVPGVILRALAPLTALPGLPRIGADEIRRLLEDKAFDIGPMRRILGIGPMPLDTGLALTFQEHGDARP